MYPPDLRLRNMTEGMTPPVKMQDLDTGPWTVSRSISQSEVATRDLLLALGRSLWLKVRSGTDRYETPSLGYLRTDGALALRYLPTNSKLLMWTLSRSGCPIAKRSFDRIEKRFRDSLQMQMRVTRLTVVNLDFVHK